MNYSRKRRAPRTPSVPRRAVRDARPRGRARFPRLEELRGEVPREHFRNAVYGRDFRQQARRIGIDAIGPFDHLVRTPSPHV